MKIFFMYLLHTIEVAFYSEQVIDPHQSKLTPRANTHSKLTPQSKISRTHIPSPEQLRPRASPQSKGKVLTLGKKERKKNYCQIQFFLSISQVIICIFIICIFDLWIECVKNILIFCSKVYFHE